MTSFTDQLTQEIRRLRISGIESTEALAEAMTPFIESNFIGGPRPTDLTIEPHGEGYAVYQGRSDESHGNRLFNITDATEPGFQIAQSMVFQYTTPYFVARAWRPIEEAAEDPDAEIEVYAPAAHGLPAMVTLCKWHPDGGFTVDELRQVTHFRPHRPPGVYATSVA